MPAAVSRGLTATALALCVLIAFLLRAHGGSEPQSGLPRITIAAGDRLIDAEVASTPRQRAIGLMYRRDMPENEGMLFVFEQPAIQCFWMRNTLLPLTAAFLADDGTIVNLADMEPQSEEHHCSGQPVRYVLEMGQGWFAGHAVGQRLNLGQHQ